MESATETLSAVRPGASQQDIDELARHTGLIVVLQRVWDRTAPGGLCTREVARLESDQDRTGFLRSIRLDPLQPKVAVGSAVEYEILFYALEEGERHLPIETIWITYSGATLRWDGWHGDGCFEDSLALLEWFATMGHPEPLAWRYESEARGRETQARFNEWVAAAPLEVRRWLEERYDRFGGSQLDGLREVLEASHPIIEVRALALLRWHGAVEPVYSGYLSDENLPAELLRQMEVKLLVEVLKGESAHSPAMRGAARLFLTWRFPKRRKRIRLAPLVADIVGPLRETAMGLQDTYFHHLANKLLPLAE